MSASDSTHNSFWLKQAVEGLGNELTDMLLQHEASTYCVDEAWELGDTDDVVLRQVANVDCYLDRKKMVRTYRHRRVVPK